MSLPNVGRLLGLDWGEVRIGLALSDETQTLATPLETLVRRRGQALSHGSVPGARRRSPAGGLVVGLPLTGEGEEEDSAVSARELAGELAERSGLPVELWDERMSTARALAAIREQGGSTRGRREDVDSLAAAVLLQHYLDARRARAE